MKYILFIFLFLISSPLLAKVELIVPAKPAIPRDQVQISMYDRGQFEKCEEMGIVHNKSWSGWQTKKGLFKRMRKQVGKVGGTHVLVHQTNRRGSQEATGSVFYCPSK